jgi:hypothetical protein
MTLAEKLLAVHEALSRAGIEHAFGGAIALAYWTSDPRGTSDIDVNIFIPAERAATALEALPDGVEVRPETAERIARDGQIRLFWEGTPVDLFFDYDELHAAAARNSRQVPFSGAEIPVLGPVELAAFKAMFDRTRDWADIEAMLVAQTLDLDALRTTLERLIDTDDGRFERIATAARRADETRGAEGPMN